MSATEQVDISTATGEGLAGWEWTQMTQQSRDGEHGRRKAGHPSGMPGYDWKRLDPRFLPEGHCIGVEIDFKASSVVIRLFE